MKDDMKEKVANFILDFQARNRQVRDAREAEIIQTEQIRSVMRGASALVEASNGVQGATSGIKKQVV